MQIWEAIRFVDDSTTISNVYARGYRAHISMRPGDQSRADSYVLTCVKEEMPPHSTELLATRERVEQRVEQLGWVDGWKLDPDD